MAYSAVGAGDIGWSRRDRMNEERGRGVEENGAEAARRRTFAIISHPDAGKTTLTEKLLLYSGSVHLAGSVKARRSGSSTISDWMAMEQQRGISISSTVLAFDYEGCRCNLLDTPGHADFSEDTYRTLAAVDSAVMVIDAARGVEAQTRKLFRVCRDRGIPILTFVNKMDRPGMPPLELLAVVEDALGIEAVPVNWPIGEGMEFQGVYDRQTRTVHRYQRVAHGARQAPAVVVTLDESAVEKLLGVAAARQLREDVALLDGVGLAFDKERFLSGQQTPVFFGSALTNFGVDLFLQEFVSLAPAPVPQASPLFAGFVFKIQSNLNPHHRDSLAFVRITRGVFERDEPVLHVRTQRRLRLGHASTLFGNERETVETAYPGDVIGVANPGFFAIGDTLCVGPEPEAIALPMFQPEHFAILHHDDVQKRKAFLKGLAQLVQEGAIQLLHPAEAVRNDPILAAVGRLQFDVLQFRLRAEYGVETRVEPLPHEVARWVFGSADAMATLTAYGGRICTDEAGRTVVLLHNEHSLGFCTEQNPLLRFLRRDEIEARVADEV